MNDQCDWYSAPSAIHRRSVTISCFESVRPESIGGIRSSDLEHGEERRAEGHEEEEGQEFEFDAHGVACLVIDLVEPNIRQVGG